MTSGTKKRSSNLETEQVELFAQLDALEDGIDEQKEQANGVDRFLTPVCRYMEIEKLAPEFIDKIIIYEPEQAQGNRRQKVAIVYINNGMIDLQSWQDESA